MGQGPTNALDALRRVDYRLGLVTLRPALAEAVAAQLDGLQVSTLTLDEQTRDQAPQIIVSKLCS